MVSATLTALRTAFDAFAPLRCAGCGIPPGELCGSCLAAIAAKPLLLRIAGLEVHALGNHDDLLRDAIHGLKYRNRRAVATLLSQRLGVVLGYRHVRPQVIVPVPLHPSRLSERGYNQAELIARGIAAALPALPLIVDAIARVRATQPQSRLNQARRSRNLAGAFAPGPGARRVAGKTVLLVDDVVTTGATLRACVTALDSCGVNAVSAAALAVRL